MSRYRDKNTNTRLKKRLRKYGTAICQHHIFQSWLHKNLSRFKHKPMLIKSKKMENEVFTNGLVTDLYFFKGVTKRIALTVKFYGLEMVYLDENDKWETFIDWDIGIDQNEAGKYYCSMCEDNNEVELKTYKTISELLAEHTFEKILEWVNQLSDKSTLYFYQYGGLRLVGVDEKAREVPDLQVVDEVSVLE